MIILIGGSSHSGKTLMAQKLMETYQMPYFSIDHLKMGIYRSNPDCGFTPLDHDDKIGKQLWPIVREMIKTVIENEQHLIVEGTYIDPAYLADFEARYRKQMIPIFITFSESYIRTAFHSAIIENRNAIEKRLTSDEEMEGLKDFIQGHLEVQEKCQRAHMPYIEIHEDYEKEMATIYEDIAKLIENHPKE